MLHLANSVNLLNFGISKRNILKLISSPSKAETIAKSLNNVERFEFNKTFPAFEKLFLKTYGFNNRNVSESDITTYIKAFLHDPTSINNKVEPAKTPLKIKNPLSAEPPEDIEETTPIQGYAMLPVKAEKIDEGSPQDQLKALARKNAINGNQQQQINSLYNKGIDVSTDYPELYAGLAPITKTRFQKHKKDAQDAAQYEKLKQATDKFQAGQGPQAAEAGFGLGVHMKQFSALTRFGKIFISLKKLYNNNVLSIKNAKQKSITGIPEKKVSENLSNVIMKIAEGGTITKADLHTLNQIDRHIYDNLVKLAGLHKQHENSFNDTAKHMADRLKIVEGEINAGNDEQDLLKEAHQLLHELSNCGVISGRTATQHYKHLKSFFR